MTMRLLLFPLLLGLTIATPATAWGPEGHKIVAAVAEQRLTPSARAAVKELLKGHPLASISSWADQVKRTRPETYNWHFVDIPLESAAYDEQRDCQPSPRGDCVVAAIHRSVEVLRDHQATGPERVQALMFLVHFVGDVHQPLHSTDGKTATGAPDRGGNLIAVDFYDSQTNLHRIWDTNIIEHSGSNQSELIDELSVLAETFPAETFTSASASAWATESHQQARMHTYPDLPDDFATTPPELGDVYEDAELPTVKKQLALAGYHLALVLNAVFRPPP
jgi:S1/P1 Nuclease